jgi:multidrug transporter EmrE-like cation transporter
MSIYIIAITIAALVQIGTIYFLRADFSRSFLYAIPFILAYQFLFLWSYSNAPKFIIIWFLTTALTNSLAFLVGYFLWHEQISAWNMAGIALIVGGIVLLQVK